MAIKNVNPRPLRAGHIRLGAPKTGNRPGKNIETFRIDSDGFPQEVINARLGENPKEVHIYFPKLFQTNEENLAFIFDSGYEYYRGGKRWCAGDGVSANRVLENNELGVVPCPCDALNQQGGCKQYGVMRVGIQNIPYIGFWEVRTTSWRSIGQIQQVIGIYQNLLGENFWTTSFVLSKSQQPGRSGPVWVTKLAIHSDDAKKLPMMAEMPMLDTGESFDETAYINPLVSEGPIPIQDAHY